MLMLKNIEVTLGKGSKLERKVLTNISLTAQNRDFIMLVGSNGAGKSTIFNIISGFLKPDAGRIIIDGRDVTALAQNYRARFITKVMQDPRIGTMENMTIFENMAFALKRGQARGFLPFFNKKRTHFFQEKLKLLNMGLEYRLDELVSNLSGGQRQALSLIMATMCESKLLLLDEITAALDPKTAETIMELTAKIVQEEQRTCIMITHNMVHAIKYGNRLLILKDSSSLQEYSSSEKAHLTPLTLISKLQ